METTGLFPFRHDRVIEVAAVVVGGDGAIEREFVSLVNPGRDIGPSSIHGLSSADIISAPQFGEIVAQLLDVLAGTVAVAGHNVRFDLDFLDFEFHRLGYEFPRCISLCTMQLTHGGRLADCCRQFGVPIEGEAHQALTDARATARLLTCLLSDQPRLRGQLNGAPPIQWPLAQRFNKAPLTRDESRRRQAEPPTFLQLLLQRANPAVVLPASDGSELAYLALLGRAFEDRHVDESEAEALVEAAIRWGLTSDLIQRAHRDYFKQLCRVAVSDRVVTDSERRDLKLVARLLGLEQANLDATLDEAIEKLSASAPTNGVQTAVNQSGLAGAKVCFTGELNADNKAA